MLLTGFDNQFGNRARTQIAHQMVSITKHAFSTEQQRDHSRGFDKVRQWMGESKQSLAAQVIFKFSDRQETLVFKAIHSEISRKRPYTTLHTQKMMN